ELAMALQIWQDGKLVDKDHAVVSVYDHGLLYGDGVFEGIRAYNGKILEEQAHLDRLYDSAKAIRLEIPYTKAELSEAMYGAMKANELSDAYIRLVVTRGVGDLGLDPRKCPRAGVFCIADSIALYPEELYEKGLPIITSSWTKNHPNATPPRIKSLNYLNSILGKIDAIDAGVLEAVMLNHLGFVAECTGDNIFIVKDGRVITPPTEAGILDGITRDVVMRLCKKHGIELVEANLVRHDLYTADECFLTGTAAEVIGVIDIDGRTVGDGKPGPITRKLKDAFFRYATGETSLD
ncbi:MAG: branched-chain-amino-acid transaminase, partial [Planctomycetota bacterium]